MTTDEATAASLAREWREARTAFLALAATIPETRAYRNTDRAGWTLKHELAYLAALDAEVLHLLAATRDGLTEHLGPPDLRRLRGQAMHQAKEMRLRPLCERLAAAGEETARAIEAAPEAMSRTVADAEETRTVGEHVAARLQRTRAGLETLRAVLG